MNTTKAKNKSTATRGRKPVKPDPERFKDCTKYELLRPLPKTPKKRIAPRINWLDDGALLVQAGMTQQLYQELFALVDKGDDRALALIIKNVFAVIEGLENRVERDPVRFHQWSHAEIRWPSFIGKKKVLGERAKRFIELLELSKSNPLRHKWDPNSPATQSAHQMIAWLEENQETLKLPPLSRDTWEHWFDVGWQGLITAANGTPEKDPYLRKIAEGMAETKWNVRGQSRGTPRGSKDAESGKEGIIRYRLRTALKQGVKTIVKNL
jgi:hypothetical protein